MSRSIVTRSKRCVVTDIAFSRYGIMRLPIRTRLSLRFGLLVGLVIAGLGAYLYFEVRADLLSTVDRGLHVRTLQIEGAITRSTGSVVPHSQYFRRYQSFEQVFTGKLQLVEASWNVQGAPMLPPKTIASVTHSAYFTRTMASKNSDPIRILVTRYRQPGPDGFVLVGE